MALAWGAFVERPVRVTCVAVTPIRVLSISSALVLLAACASTLPSQTPEDAKSSPSAGPVAASSSDAAPTASPGATGPAASSSPSEVLARDLIKAGGRRIGYSASKKRFLVPIEIRSEGGRGLDLRLFDSEGQPREIERVCQPGECEEHLDEIAKDLIPKLAARLEKEGYETVYSVGWPSGRDEIDVASLNARLRYEKGRLLTVREKKPAVSLRALGGRAPKATSLSAVFPVPTEKLLGAFVAEGAAIQEFFVFKLP